LGITVENYPKIDGSTSTLGIVRAIYQAMFENARNVHYREEASKTVPSYEKLINGEVDLIIVPYASAAVLKGAEDKGVELDFYPVAAEALVFITPKDNEVESITMEQVRSIYLDYGIRDWSSLGGSKRELVPIGRNADSGSQSQMDNLILKDKEMHPLIQENHVELTMEGMLEQVAFYHNGGMDSGPTDSYALGYTLYTYLQNMTEVTGIGEHLKMLAFDGVVPSEESIADRSYSLSDGYYAVMRSDLSDEHSARKIVSWLTDEEGKAAVSDLGFIPMR
jgi:phosphate transport system substrate-binding protein